MWTGRSVSEPLEKRQLLSASPVTSRASASKLDSSLTSLYANYVATGSSSSAEGATDNTGGANSTSSLLEISNGSVELQSFARAGQHSNLVAELKRLKATNITGKAREVDAMVPISALGKLATAGSLRFAQAGIQVVNSGVVTSQGDIADQAAIARAAFSINGAGVKVGIISDSFNTSAAATDKYTNDVASGDLPSNVQVLADGLSTDTDEGRALAQVIYDSAPGSSLAFATAGSTQGTFANNIRSLAADGARVIVDDVTNIYEPMFEDGTIAQAVTAVTNSGVTYISAAGNRGTNGYAANWSAGTTYGANAIPNAPGAPVFFGGTAFNFGTALAPSSTNAFQLAAGASIKLSFQWDSPYYSVSGTGSANQLDAYVLNAGGTQVVGGSASYVVGADPIQVFQFTNTTANPVSYNLMLVSESGAAPSYIKYVDFGQSTGWQFAPNAGTIFGHANAAGAETIGAVAYSNTPAYGVSTPILESFSGQGGTPILFNTAGGRLAPNSIINRQEPSLVGPDGVYNTFYNTNQATNAYPTFFGTSAAAAGVAAVAALFIQKNPALSPAQVDTALQNTAVHFGGATPNPAAGYGLVQAVAGITTFVANITGTIFHDNNANTNMDAGETGYGTVTVFIDSNNNGLLDAGEPVTNSAANGTYAFYNQTFGSVVVRIVPPSGTISTTYGKAVTISAVQATGVNIGVFPISFSGNAGGYTYTLQTDPTTNANLDIITPTTTYTAPKSLIPSLSFILGGGNNTLNVNFSSGTPVPLGGAIFVGTTGTTNNTLNLNGTSGVDNFSVYGATTFYNGSSGVTADNIQSEIINGNGNNDLFSVEAAQPAAMSLLQFNGGPGNQTLTIDDILPNNGVGTVFNAGTNTAYTNTLNVNMGTFTFLGNPAATAANLTVNLQNTANVNNVSSGVVFAAGALNSGINVRNLAALNISPGTFNTDSDNPIPPPPTVTVAAPASHADRAVLVVGSLSISGASVLDLNANDMIVTSGSISTVNSLLKTGFNGGAWNGGAGIESSAAASDTTHLTAIGSLLNNNNGSPFFGGGTTTALFDGQSPGLTAILLKYTYYGDADLSGVVDGSDYSRTDNGLLQNATGWVNGDFNYDSLINGSDYTLLDNAFNTQGSPL